MSSPFTINSPDQTSNSNRNNSNQRRPLTSSGSSRVVAAIKTTAAADDRIKFGSSQTGKSAYDWDIYKNRKTALLNLKHHCTLVDLIIETEDGLHYELVHSQVISAFGEKLNEHILQNGTYVETYREHSFSKTHNLTLNNTNRLPVGGNQITANWSRWPGRVKLVRLPKLTKYTLQVLVECAYSGFIRTDLQTGGIWQVFELADYYEMFEVIKACCLFLVKNLSPLNCIQFYHIGIRHRHNLQRNAWNKIRANFKHILIKNIEDQAMVAAASSRPRPATKQTDQPAIDNQQAASAQEQPAGQEDPFAIYRSQDNSLATIKFEHFEPLLQHDKLNVDNEEMVWWAIRLWCSHKPSERASMLSLLLPCMRFPRFKSGTEFSSRFIWRDQLILDNKLAQQQLAILDRNHRDFLYNSSNSQSLTRDGFDLACAVNPKQLRPRIPYSILLAIGGWQQGQPTTLIESYDLNCNLWFEFKKRIMQPLAYHGIENIQNVLYICGGTDGAEILNEVFTFNPVNGVCLQKPSMREARCYVSTAYLNNQLYALGGHNGMQRMKSVEKLEIMDRSGQLNVSDNSTWQHVQEMNVARSDASASVYNKRIYIAGGLNDIVIESSVEFFNPVDNSWTFIASMQTPRTSFNLLLYRDQLLAIGGNNGNERLSSVEAYDFKRRSWSYHSDLRHRRSTFSAALLDETKLVVVGGYNGQTPFNQVEMYDELSQQWVPLQRIKFDRSGLKVVVVNDLPNAIDYTFLGSQGCSQLLNGATD